MLCRAILCRTLLSRALLAVCVAGGLLAAAHAQGIRHGRDPRTRKAMKPELVPFVAEGTVRAVMPGKVQMLTDSAQNWVIVIDRKTVVRVTGTAQPDFLKVGMFIRFTAEVDKRGSVKKKLEQLTIFTPSQQDPLGVWPEGKGPADEKPAEDERRFGRGIRGGPANRDTTTAAVYTIAGRITGSRKGRLTVNALRASVRVELAENAKIDVDFADYTVAKPGDRISVTRGKMFPGRIGLGQALEMSIKLSQPLSLAKKKPAGRKPPAAKRPRRHTQKANSRKELPREKK